MNKYCERQHYEAVTFIERRQARCHRHPPKRRPWGRCSFDGFYLRIFGPTTRPSCSPSVGLWFSLCNDAPVQPHAVSDKRTFPVRTTLVTNWHEAEKIAAAWMYAFGFVTAKLTPGGADLGVDVRAPQVAIAQVKRKRAAIGRPEVQLLVGGRHPALLEKMLFFSRSAYLESATQWANWWAVALFRFDDFGNPFPENKSAREVCHAAGYGAWRSMTPPTDRWVSQETAQLRRELILSRPGNPVRSSTSAMLAIKTWAAACGFTDAIRPSDEPELVTAKGLIILVNFRGEKINALDIAKVANYRGERVRVVVSWVGFTAGAKRAAQQHAVALLKCSTTGVLTDVNEAAGELFAF